MPISKEIDFDHTFSIITIIFLCILLFTNSSGLLLPIIAKSYALNNSHQVHKEHQEQQQPISQTPFRITTTSNQESAIPNVLANSNKVVIITFGDGYQSQYTLAKPILDKYGYKGNFFITCNRVGTPTKMTWPELVQLYKEGNVIGSKTVNYGTKAMENKDLNHLSPQELELEVGQSKQCLLNHGINTAFFAVPKNLANNNATVINTIAKYYTLAINGHSNLMYLNCSGGIRNSTQTDCRAFLGNGNLTPENRYSVGEWSMQHLGHGNSFNDSQMFGKFIEEMNSQNKFNNKGIVNAIPLIGYHDIVTYPDAKYSSVSSDTTLNLFDKEIKYIHDNGFKVLTFYNLGYDDKNNVFFIKQ